MERRRQQRQLLHGRHPKVNVTVGLTAAHTTLAVYDLIMGTTAIKSASNANSIVAQVTDHPLLALISNALTSGGTGGGATTVCKLQ